MSPSIGNSERLRRTERVISFIRLAVVLFNVAAYQLMAPESDRRGLANAICVIASVYAFTTVLYRPTKERSYAAAYTNMVLDNLFIGLWLYSTDGFASPFYPLFYAEAAASVGRFGPVAGNGGDLDRATALITQLGLPLYRPLANEPWHFELRGSRG